MFFFSFVGTWERISGGHTKNWWPKTDSFTKTEDSSVDIKNSPTILSFCFRDHEKRSIREPGRQKKKDHGPTMLTVTTDIGKCLAIVEFNASRRAWSSSPDLTNRAGSIPSSGSFSASLTRSLNDKGGGGGGQNHIHRVPNTQHGTTSRWLCRSVPPDDDEYRSSRNIAITLFRRYKTAVERGGGENLKEFISAGVNAYALGCTSEGLRDELADLKESGVEIEAMQISGGNTSVKAKIFSEEIDECILWLSIVFITILCTPQPTVIRWSSVSPVSDDLLIKWKGFCGIIANAYYIRGMAWLPVKTLQLEQMAIMGRAEEASVVASRMRLVFSTLEVVSPQWPRV